MLTKPRPYLVDNSLRSRVGGIRKTDLTSKNYKVTPTPLPDNQFLSSEDKNKPFQSSVFVWINTYNRPHNLKNLLKDIYENREDFQLKVFVLDDCSDQDYTDVLRSFAGKLDILYHKVITNHGKKLYWKLCNYALNKIHQDYLNYQYFIKIDDDCRLIKNFFKKCVNIWETINDKRKICLNFRLDSREGKPVWTEFVPRVYRFENISVYLSQWVDMDFFCTAEMFKALNFRINEQPLTRWRFNKATSSGVGRDISIRLSTKGYHLYLTTESLVCHDHHDSKMNPEERGRNPLITKPFTNFQYGLPL